MDERNKMCYCVIIMFFSTENQGGRKKQNVLLCYYYALFNRESGWMKRNKIYYSMKVEVEPIP